MSCSCRFPHRVESLERWRVIAQMRDIKLGDGILNELQVASRKSKAQRSRIRQTVSNQLLKRTDCKVSSKCAQGREAQCNLGFRQRLDRVRD